MKRWRMFATARGRPIFREELDHLGPGPKGQVLDAMKRKRQGLLLPREDEFIGGDIHAIRTDLDGCTYRVLYALDGAHDEILLALHALDKRSRKLPPHARRLAEKRLKDWRANGKHRCG